MTATTEGGRFARLPLWAQREIASLRATADHAKARAEAAEKAAKATVEATGAVAWLNPYDAVPTPVAPRGEYVRFSTRPDGTLDTWSWLDVRVARERNVIDVMSARGLRIRPRASNTFTIELEDR